MKKLLIPICLLYVLTDFAQNKITPEVMMQMGRVNVLGISKDKQYILYSVSTPDYSFLRKVPILQRSVKFF